jgi:hypothetical protein
MMKKNILFVGILAKFHYIIKKNITIKNVFFFHLIAILCPKILCVTLALMAYYNYLENSKIPLLRIWSLSFNHDWLRLDSIHRRDQCDPWPIFVGFIEFWSNWFPFRIWKHNFGNKLKIQSNSKVIRDTKFARFNFEFVLTGLVI